MKHQRIVVLCMMFALCFGSSMAASVANIWDQCGGSSCPSGECKDEAWADTKCAAGLKCFRESQYYYQCRATATVYQQCGGTSCQFKGVCSDRAWAACTDGNSCVRKNEYYWQCIPPSQLQAQTTSTQAKTAAAASQKNMRLSKAQLAHVPIPRHSVVLTSKKPAASASVSIASVAPARANKIVPEQLPEQIRPAGVAAVATAAVKPQSAPAETEVPAKNDAAVATAAMPAMSAPVGMPYSSEPTKPANAAHAATAAMPAVAAAKPADAKPAAAAAVGMPYSTEPTKPAEKPSGAAAVTTAAASKSDGSKPFGRHPEDPRSNVNTASLQWERPDLATASVMGPGGKHNRHPIGSQPKSHSRPSALAATGPRVVDFDTQEEEEMDAEEARIAAAAMHPAARAQPSRFEPVRLQPREARDSPRGMHLVRRP